MRTIVRCSHIVDCRLSIRICDTPDNMITFLELAHAFTDFVYLASDVFAEDLLQYFHIQVANHLSLLSSSFLVCHLRQDIPLEMGDVPQALGLSNPL